MKKAVCIIFLFAILLNLFLVTADFPLSGSLFKALIKNDRTPFAFVELIDSAFEKVRGGNDIFVAFEGFSDDKGKGMGNPRDVASLIYFRACQQLFPQKVHVMENPARIVRGTEFLDHPFIPDEEWLEAHGVSAIFKFIRNTDGSVSLEFMEK